MMIAAILYSLSWA